MSGDHDHDKGKCECGRDHSGEEGIAIPLSAIFGGFREQRERQEMASEAIKLSVDNLLDSLSPDQLRTLRIILNCGSKKILINLDGQVISILRLVHRINPDSGESLDIDRLEKATPAGDG